MDPTYKKYGFTKADLPIIQAFQRQFPELTAQQKEACFGWYRDVGRSCRSETEFLEKGRHFAQVQSIDEGTMGLILDLALGSAQLLAEGQELPQQPAPSHSEDSETIRAAQELMRTDRARYESDLSMQRAYFAALERREPPDPSTVSTGAAVVTTPPQPTGSDAERKAEIEQLLKTDYAEYHRSGAGTELTQILQREESAQSTED